ncbi:hypothetical protein NQ318_000838 [Aromia moschata]|uniref:DDE Tnp4 domain-containing protein n=1 Tax=Aromia moschata TaxID=1265417 RepID=A0AAV8XRD8_9CUCU|nr:hypothetical protein NQ318_000838 [Aromia moschata]
MSYLTESLIIEIWMMIGYGDRARTQCEVVRLFRETHPDLPPLNQGTISKIEAQYREMGHVRKVPSKRQAVVDDDTKLNLLLALEENPITPVRQLARDISSSYQVMAGIDEHVVEDVVEIIQTKSVGIQVKPSFRKIQIEKPSDSVKQALTWSEYKKCNTLKYLISSTPDGFTNFISRGYGGRISDSLLVEDSGYLEIVPAGCGVMADRGFKGIGKLLHERNCQLVRPPSVSSAEKPTKAEVLETKRIASLRIHIERAHPDFITDLGRTIVYAQQDPDTYQIL